MAYTPTGTLVGQDFYQILAGIEKEFPQAIPLLKQPGVLDVYAQAIDQGWTGDRVEAALEQTPWWTSTPDVQRQWQALQITDPATAKVRAAATQRMFVDAQKQLGMSVDTTGGFASPGFQLYQRAVSEGWDAARIKYELAAVATGDTTGELGNTATTIRKQADDMGVSLSDPTVLQWAPPDHRRRGHRRRAQWLPTGASQVPVPRPHRRHRPGRHRAPVRRPVFPDSPTRRPAPTPPAWRSPIRR